MSMSQQQADLAGRLYRLAQSAGLEHLSRDEVAEQVAADALSGGGVGGG